MSEDNKLQALFNDCVERKLDKNATIMELATRGGLDVTQAVREYQRMAKGAGIVLGTKERTEKVNEMLPSQNRNSLEDMVKFVEELIGADKKRPEIVEALQNEMGYTANSAASAYSRATRELGISTGRVGTSVPLSELVEYVRANQGMPRKDLVQAMHNDLGYAESTANSFLTYVNFAKEWAKQEIAAQN